MLRTTSFFRLAIIAALTAAPAVVHAQAPVDGSQMPMNLGGGVVGGGGATLSGGADDMTITYSQRGAGGGASYEQPGRIGIFAGNSGGNPSFTYTAPSSVEAGREAWLQGGGDDAQVLYIAPRRR
ncbi:hypothetical protein E2C06_13460 [Dankookia rubra]|uniref:Uncharacterized protein n=1 Tax=Dankookia rubra TaxID=1442381 RepID=A0A4V3AA90_9PROT|nr:hypothetical protein [Dankookia rubra]TDH62175.1 hypothetical protein E2C06_13460 [Dankookia rubra]